MSYKVPTFQFFSWLSVAKAWVRRAIQKGEDKVFRLFSEQNPTVGLGNKERDFRKIFVPFFARAILLHIQWSSSNKCDRKTILDDYWVEILAGKCLRCPNRLAKGFTGTKNLFNTFLSSIRRYKLPNKKTRESVQKLKLQICYSMKSVMINQKRFFIWRLSCLK